MKEASQHVPKLLLSRPSAKVIFNRPGMMVSLCNLLSNATTLECPYHCPAFRGTDGLLTNAARLLTPCVLSSAAKIPYFTAGYIVASMVMPSLTAAAMVIRPTKQQSHNLRSHVVKAVFGKPLANTNACFLFLERMQALDPQWIFLYSSLCAWHRAFQCIPGLASQIAHALQLPSLSRKKAAGPIAILLDDLERLNLQLLPDGCSVHDAHDQLVFKFDTVAKGKLQHIIREKMRACDIQDFATQSPKWTGIERVNLKATASVARVARQQHTVHTGHGPPVHEKHTLTSICRTITNAHPTPHRLHLMHLAETPHCRLCDHDCGDSHHIIWQCPFSRAFVTSGRLTCMIVVRGHRVRCIS